MGHPRSISTALERVMKNADGLDVLHEPFTDTYYFSSKRRSRRYGDPAVRHRIPSRRMRSTPGWRLAGAGRFSSRTWRFRPSPMSPTHCWRPPEHLPDPRPAQGLCSLVRIKPDFTEDEFGFTALERIWNRVHALQGAAIALDGENFAPTRMQSHTSFACGAMSAILRHVDVGRRSHPGLGASRGTVPGEMACNLEKSRRILPPAAETPGSGSTRPTARW
ncbi:MAG: hypothetical protein HPM95_00190 [Alphaproteobacteria bacterium]|nr:hypothetical protein [Alphaproteobacteria bacterium]